MTSVYIANCNTSVFNSQVIFLANYFIQNYSFKKLYLLIGYSSKRERETVSVNLIDPAIDIIFYKRYPDYPFFSFLNIRSVRSALGRIEAVKSNVDAIHIRTEVLGYYLLKALPSFDTSKILIDVRGALYPEIQIYYKWFIVRQLKIRLLNIAHKHIRKKRVRLSCVSHELKSYMVSKYSHKKDYININSCAYSDFFKFDELQRKRIREKLKLKQDELLVVFSTGGERKWQNSDLIINHLTSVGSIKILNLSKISYKIENVLNFFVPITEMPYYLSSADVAIIIRENNLVNRVASPVKFSEYMACGLPVIANNGVALIEEIINLHRTGKVISSIEQIDEKLIQEISMINRGEVMRVAKKYFSVENISQSYYDFYCLSQSP